MSFLPVDPIILCLVIDFIYKVRSILQKRRAASEDVEGDPEIPKKKGKKKVVYGESEIFIEY